MSSADKDFPEYHEDISPLLFYTLLGPLFVVGLVGNSLFILIIAVHTKMRTITNKFICNLSVANLVTILAAALGPVLDSEDGPGGDNPWICDVTQLLHETGSCAALFTLVALSADRFYAVRRPLQKQTITCYVLLVVWIVSFVVSFSELQVTGDPVSCTRADSRFYLTVLLEKSSLFGFLLTCFIPLAVTAVFFVLMVREMFLAVSNPVDVSMKNAFERCDKVKQKVTWVVLVLVIGYSVCFLPFYIVSLIINISPEKASHLAKAVNVLFMLTDVFPCVNPIILYSLSEPCRKHIRHYLYQCCPGYIDNPKDDRPRLYSNAVSATRVAVVRSASVITTTV